MNAKDRYNEIIAEIEKGACDENIRTDEIVRYISKKFGYDMRELNSLFSFMTGDTMLAYIKGRKLMAAYRLIITSDKSSKETMPLAVSVSGYNDQSAFCHKFSDYFKMKPTEAYKLKDTSLVTNPQMWDDISFDCTFPDLKEDEMKSKTKFGLPQEIFDKIIEAYELENLYSFSPMFSQIAFELSEELSLPLTITFSFADKIRDCGNEFEDEEYDDDGLTPDGRMREIACDPFIQYLYFECNLSPEFAFDLMDRCYKYTKEDLMKMEKELIRSYAMLNEYIHFDTYKAAYEYYYQNANEAYEDEDFENYLDYICAGMPKEEAFKEIIPSGELYDYCDENAKISDMLSDVLDLYEDDNEYFTSNEYIEDFNEDEYYYDEDIEDKGMVEECYFDKYFGEDEI